MATLFSARTTDGAGSCASHTGPCTVFAENDSVFDGCSVVVQAAAADTAGKYVTIGQPGQLTSPGAIAVNIQGTYFLRGVVNRAGSSTSINLVTTQ